MAELSEILFAIAGVACVCVCLNDGLSAYSNYNLRENRIALGRQVLEKGKKENQGYVSRQGEINLAKRLGCDIPFDEAGKIQFNFDRLISANEPYRVHNGKIYCEVTDEMMRAYLF